LILKQELDGDNMHTICSTVCHQTHPVPDLELDPDRDPDLHQQQVQRCHYG
jgi:hypothetical protein